MKTVRLLAVLWLILGAAIWNGFFDLYVSRGAREYGQLRVEAEQGRGPQPDMAQVMARAKRAGVQAASLWAVLVVGGGWASLWAASRASRV